MNTDPGQTYAEKNISIMKINNIILMLRTRIILFSSFVIFFFWYMSLGKFSYYNETIVKRMYIILGGFETLNQFWFGCHKNVILI